MLSKSQIKHVSSLKLPKFRQESGQFIAEGHKLVMELLNSRFVVRAIFAIPEWLSNYRPTKEKDHIQVTPVTQSEMQRISQLASPSPVLAVVEIPRIPIGLLSNSRTVNSLSLALDDIRDPGNMGTMIRIADWFGIQEIFCSENCVDLYNPKVVQATMGSITRVNVTYGDLREVLDYFRSCNHAIYGAFLEGNSLYSETRQSPAILLIGNESRGISPELESFVTHKIFIPSFGEGSGGKAESLNASVAAAIICAEFRRPSI